MQKEINFVKAWKHIRRKGAEEMLEWLTNETDFFEAPASRNHHLARPGGLAIHSLNVWHRLREITIRDMADHIQQHPADLPAELEETVAVLGLLHDVCKVNVYHAEIKRRKNPGTGAWEDYRGYTYRDSLPLGHGEKSLFLIARFMPLTNGEALAIRWHMGAYDFAVKGGSSDINAALRLSPWLWRLQEADMCAAYIDEVDT